MSNRRLAAQSGLWSVVLQWSRFGLNTVVFLILARWLSLAEIGAFAVAFAPINILQLVQRSGFSEAVVQGRSEPASFTDTIFWMSVGFGIVMSFCIFGLSFVIGPIMQSEEAESYLAAMAIIPALIGMGAVPEGLLRQRLEMRTLAIRTTASLSVAGLFALWLGYIGYGGWALTIFAIVNALLSSIFVVVLLRWTPGGGPRLKDARKALPVLAAISGRGIISSSTIPILQLMVGAVLGPAAAGAFQIAQRFLSLASTVTLTPLRFAALPVFVRVRDDADRLRRVVAETAGLVSLVSAPTYFGLLAVAPTLLPLAVGEANGGASVAVLQGLLLVGGNVGLFTVFSQAMVATGRYDIAFRWSLTMFILNMVAGGITVMFSEQAVALGYSLVGYLAVPVLLKLVAVRIGVSRRTLASAVFGPMALALVMVLGILLFRYYFGEGLTQIKLLAAEIAVGATIYTVLSLFMSRPQIRTTRSLLVSLLPRRLQA